MSSQHPAHHPPSRAQAPRRSPPNSAMYHTESAPRVPPTAMRQHPPPQGHGHHQAPTPIRTNLPGPPRGPPPTETPMSPPYSQPQTPSSASSRPSSAAQSYTPLAHASTAPAENPQAPSPTSRYPPPPTDNPHAPSHSSRYPNRPPPAPAGGKAPYSMGQAPPAHAYPPGYQGSHPQNYSPSPQHTPQQRPHQPTSRTQSPYQSPQGTPQQDSFSPPSRVPTLQELEGGKKSFNPKPRSRPKEQAGPDSLVNKGPAKERINDKETPTKALTTGAKTALGHEGVMDSVELAFEGVVKAASTI